MVRRWYERWKESPAIGPRDKIAAWITGGIAIFVIFVFVSAVLPFAVAYGRQSAKINAWENFQNRLTKEAGSGTSFAEISDWAGTPDHFQDDPDLIRSESHLAQKSPDGVTRIAIFMHRCRPISDHFFSTCPDERLLAALDEKGRILWTHREIGPES